MNITFFTLEDASDCVYPELNEISYLLADFRDYLGDVIDALPEEEE